MSEQTAKFKLRTAEGQLAEVDFNVREYNAAAEQGLSLSQYLNQQHSGKTDTVKYGDVLQQFMLHEGLFTNPDRKLGYRSPTMKEVLDTGIQMGSIVRNDGSQRHTPSGRLLFPEIIMRTIESQLNDNYDDFLGGWAGMIAQTATITGPKFDQPVINVQKAKEAQSMPIAQLAEPDVMLGITLSDKSFAIPTRSIGLLISDQAAQSSTLDLVNLIMTAQARQERVRMAEKDISAIFSGDVDRNETAKPSFTAQSLDAAITTAGTITHKAWVKYIYRNRRRMTVNKIVADLDTAMALQARSGKPTRDTVFYGEAEAFNNSFTVDNLTGADPQILVVDDGVIAANTVGGLDSRYALRRVVNISAQYSAIEQFVLRRATAFRVDFGEMTHSLYSDAFKVMTLTT